MEHGFVNGLIYLYLCIINEFGFVIATLNPLHLDMDNFDLYVNG